MPYAQASVMVWPDQEPGRRGSRIGNALIDSLMRTGAGPVPHCLKFQLSSRADSPGSQQGPFGVYGIRNSEQTSQQSFFGYGVPMNLAKHPCFGFLMPVVMFALLGCGQAESTPIVSTEIVNNRDNLLSVCNSQSLVGSPAANVDQRPNKIILLDDNVDYPFYLDSTLPAAWIPQKIGEVEFVGCVSQTRVLLLTCNYTEGIVVNHEYTKESTISVREASTGNVVFDTTFNFEMNSTPTCDPTATFSVSVDYTLDDLAKSIKDWLTTKLQ
jgi:hypothetical protein